MAPRGRVSAKAPTDPPAEVDRVGVIHESDILRRGITSCLNDDAHITVVSAIPHGDPPAQADVVVASEGALEGGTFRCPVVVCVDRAVPPPKPPVAAVVHWPLLTAGQLIVVVRAAAAGFRVEPSDRAQPDTGVDPRGIEVLRLLAAGATTRTISVKLFYSERTVKSIIHDMETELRAATRSQVVAEALRRGLI
jgi:DNA-binding CsgD family transcriptional regulator